jgi:tetratricopeptide (TPR) repeat protein
VWLPDSETRLATPDDPKGAVDLGWQLVGAAEVDATVLNRYGWKQVENDNLDEAEEAFEATLAKEPDNLDALLGSSAVYGAREDSERLSQIADRLLPLVPNRQEVSLGDLVRFIGYEIQSLGNGRVQVDLYFQAIEPMNTDYAVWLHAYVHEEDAGLLPEDRQQHGFVNLGHPMSYPTSRWTEGSIYRDRKVGDLTPGEYRFVFGVWLPDSEARLATLDDPKGAIDLGWHAVDEG